MRTEQPSTPKLGQRPSRGPRARFEFNADDDRTIIDGVAEGVSAGALVQTLGCSRGQADSRITFLRRIGMIPPPAPGAVAALSSEPKRTCANPLGAQRTRKPDARLPTFQDTGFEAARDGNGVRFTMATIGDSQCRYPFGDVGTPVFHLCGHKADGSWCPHHLRRVAERLRAKAA